MAIYHATTKPVSKSSGRSAVAAAAYRAGERIESERTGKTHDYTKKNGVLFAEALDAQGFAVDRSQLWNAADNAENRKDGRVAREWLVALPSELGANERCELAQGFAQELRERYGVATDVCIHAPDSAGDNRNYHAHILTTTRVATRDRAGNLELGAKSEIEWSNKRREAAGLPKTQDEIKTLRASWAERANTALERSGSDQRIDHRSHAERGLTERPTIKMGQAATDLERRGISTERGDKNRVIRMGNQLMQLEIESKTQSKPAAPALSDRLEQKLAERAAKRSAEERIAAKLAARERERIEQQKIQLKQAEKRRSKPKDRGMER